MQEHIINSSIGNKICRVKCVHAGFYRVSLDGVFAGHIRRDGSGWMLEDTCHDELTAENTQLIGDKIDALPGHLMQ